MEEDGESNYLFGGNGVPRTEKSRERRKNDLVCTSFALAWEEEVVEVEAVPVRRVRVEPEGLEPNKCKRIGVNKVKDNNQTE